MSFEPTPLEGVWVIRPKIYEDLRGYFMEVYRQDIFFKELGLEVNFVQDNMSHSFRNVVRGLHFQWDPPMGKLMQVTAGRAYLVGVDIRRDSATRGQWYGIEASAENRIQVWAPAGFARGFCALTEIADVQYKCTGTYNPRGESGILWNDPEIGITWPVSDPILSDKDRNAQTLAQWLSRPESEHFQV